MLKRLFDFDPRTMTVRREVVAGLTTFLTMAYILAVNPNVLSSTGMDRDALFTTTVIASVFATLVMAFYAKLPFALAPGMGLNAFFAYTVCLTMGYPWQFALTAVLIEGILFILLTAENCQCPARGNSQSDSSGHRLVHCIYRFATVWHHRTK